MRLRDRTPHVPSMILCNRLHHDIEITTCGQVLPPKTLGFLAADLDGAGD